MPFNLQSKPDSCALTGERSLRYLEFMEEQKLNDVEEKVIITGEPTADAATCKFVVDRTIYPEKSAYFVRESADGSALARRLFEIPEVSRIMIAGNEIRVTKTGSEPWPEIGKGIGTKIREHIRSGEPAVSPDYSGSPAIEEGIRKKVKDLFEKEINPALGSHGGWVELVDVKGSSVYVKLGGGCQGCAGAKMTLKMGIERIVREKVPEVSELLDATDHSGGANPYQS